MELNDMQKVVVTTDEPKVLVISAAASGKAQPNNTMIPTPHGYKQIGEIKVGDYVFNRYGQPTKVLGVFPQGKQRVYKVKLADGRETKCCGEHLWSYDNGHKGLTTKTTKEIFDKGVVKKDNRGHNSYKFRIPNLKRVVQYPEKELPINPYVLGCFIGDGCCTETGLTISSNDEELVNIIAELCNFKYTKNSKYNYNWTFRDEQGNRIHTKDFFAEVSTELVGNCHEKRIPIDYLISGEEQRFELLRGLMDTDGYVGDGRNSPCYFTVNYNLALDVAELARSLGFHTQIFTQDRRPEKKSIEYKVNIFTGPDNVYKIFKLSRKKDKALTFIGRPCRANHDFISIYDISETEEFCDMTCIYVDNKEHLYLTNNFIITHNTAVLTARLKYLLDKGEDPSKIVCITFTNAAAAVLRERIGNYPSLFIGTVHSYCNRLLLMSGYDTSKIINDENFDELFEIIKGRPQAIKEVNHLLLDEGQDSTEDELFFMLDIVQPKNFMIVADWKQQLYSFRGADSTRLRELSQDWDVMTYDLNKNYRNGSRILSFAKDIIKKNGKQYVDYSIPMRGTEGQVIEGEFTNSQIAEAIKNDGHYNDWFVLCRTNNELSSIKSVLEKAGIPCDSFKRAELDAQEFAEAMARDTVKVLTIHTSKGLERKNVVVIGARFYNADERCVSYVAATRAIDKLIWVTNKPKKKPVMMKW